MAIKGADRRYDPPALDRQTPSLVFSLFIHTAYMTVVLTKQVSVSKKNKKKNSLLVRENTNPTWEGGNANLGFYGPKINLGVVFFPLLNTRV